MNEAQLHPTVGTMLTNAALTEGRITHKRIPSKPRDRQDRNRAQGCIQVPKLDRKSRKSGSQENGYLRGRWRGSRSYDGGWHTLKGLLDLAGGHMWVSFRIIHGTV